MVRLTSLLRLSVGLSVVSAVALRLIDSHLVGPAAPGGILSLEFCGLAADGCAALLAGWDAKVRGWAMLSLGLDYLFLVAYPAAIGLALWMMGGRFGALGQTLLRRLALLCPLMTAADATENTALVLLLNGGAGGLARLASLASCLKFALIGICLLALVAAVAGRALRRGGPPPGQNE